MRCLEFDEFVEETASRAAKAAKILFAIGEDGCTTNRDATIAAGAIFLLCKGMKNEGLDAWSVLEEGLMDLLTEDYFAKKL